MGRLPRTPAEKGEWPDSRVAEEGEPTLRPSTCTSSQLRPLGGKSERGEEGGGGGGGEGGGKGENSRSRQGPEEDQR